MSIRSSLLAIVVSAASTTAWAQHTVPTKAQLERLGVQRGWVSQATLDPMRDKVTHVTVDERNVYVQVSSGTVTAFDAETGKRMWVAQLGRSDRSSYPAVSTETHLLVVAGTQVFGIEKSSGVTSWSAKVPAVPTTSPAVDEEFFYIGTLDGTIYAYNYGVVGYHYRTGRLPGTFDPSTREIRLPFGATASSLSNLWMWRYSTGRPIEVPPVRTSLMVVLADESGLVSGIGATGLDARGRLKFEFQSGFSLSSKVSVQDDIVYLPCSDHRLYAVDATKGQLIWSFAAGRPIRRKPLIIRDKMFLVSEGGGMMQLSLESGEPLVVDGRTWLVPHATELLARTKQRVFVSDRIGNVVSVDLASGVPEGSLSFDRFSIRVRNDVNDRIYMATSTGTILCLKELGSKLPTFYRNPDRSPIIPDLSEDSAADDTPPEPGR